MIRNSHKIAVALSGGVDSAVAAKILKDEGHQLVGFFLKLWSDPTCQIVGENRCCDYEALEDARSVAAKLQIPFYVVDAKKEFKSEVVDYFVDGYKNLRTPNPCVVCNEKIKFDLLLKKALEIGCDYLATGHYAIISKNSKCKNSTADNQYSLLSGVDTSKDQSYNLYRLSQGQLSKTIFPLGGMIKKEARELAVKWDLPVKEKPESQEICFFGDKDYRDFMRRHLPVKYFKQGEIIDSKGNIIGQHEGLVNYTIGQRKNINQNAKIKVQNGNAKVKNKIPLYVTGFDMEKNRLIVGEDKETYAKEMTVSDLHWINLSCLPDRSEGIYLTVKIRSQAKKVNCRIKNDESQITNHEIRVIFDGPQRSVTPGQSAVFYIGDEVIGGGIITQG